MVVGTNTAIFQGIRVASTTLYWPFLTDFILGITFAIIAGIMVFISFGEHHLSICVFRYVSHDDKLQQQMLHIDFAVQSKEDMEHTVKHAISCGASVLFCRLVIFIFTSLLNFKYTNSERDLKLTKALGPFYGPAGGKTYFRRLRSTHSRLLASIYNIHTSISAELLRGYNDLYVGSILNKE